MSDKNLIHQEKELADRRDFLVLGTVRKFLEEVCSKCQKVYAASWKRFKEVRYADRTER